MCSCAHGQVDALMYCERLMTGREAPNQAHLSSLHVTQALPFTLTGFRWLWAAST